MLAIRAPQRGLSPSSSNAISSCTSWALATRAPSRRAFSTTAPTRSSSAAPVRALIIGSPGSGKGTLSKRLLKVMPGTQYLSAGDVLRAERQAGTALGKEADEVMRSGKLMPDEAMMTIVSSQVQQLEQAKTGKDEPAAWLLDGFPRTRRQAELFDAALHRRGHALNLVLHLDVPRDVVLARILERWIHEPSGRTYNTSFNPPKQPGKDDVTGEPLVKRVDDDASTFMARLDSYDTSTAPMIDYFASQNAPALDTLDLGVVYVKLQGKTSDEIWPRMHQVLKRRYGDIVKDLQ